MLHLTSAPPFFLGPYIPMISYHNSPRAVTDIKDPRYPVDQAQLKSYYENALPYYEKARQLKPNDRTLWLNGLHRVYYNLSMGDKFNEIDALINNQ